MNHDGDVKRICLFLRKIGEDYIRAFFRESDRCRTSNTAISTRYNRSLTQDPASSYIAAFAVISRRIQAFDCPRMTLLLLWKRWFRSLLASIGFLGHRLPRI